MNVGNILISMSGGWEFEIEICLYMSAADLNSEGIFGDAIRLGDWNHHWSCDRRHVC
jgi:hypothetical protein